jgi:hypothetical protein
LPDLKASSEKAKERSKQFVAQYQLKNLKERGLIGASVFLGGTLVVILFLLGWYWGQEPEMFDIDEVAAEMLEGKAPVIGQNTTVTLIHVLDVMLHKPGGYQSNDVMPPTVFMDNISSWEFGVLTQVRDMVRTFRNDFSRSQSQSLENEALSVADPQLSFSNDTWMFPSSEGQYEKGVDALKTYLSELGDTSNHSGQFFARADNLSTWLSLVEKKLGSLSQRLSSSVGQVRVNTDLAGEKKAEQSTSTPKMLIVKTPWMEIDNVLYEARGTTWALLHFLKAIEKDFYAVLKDKNAVVSLRQIIR